MLLGVVRMSRRNGSPEPLMMAEACEVRSGVFSRATKRDETWATIELGELDAGVTLSAETMRRVVREVYALLTQL